MRPLEITVLLASAPFPAWVASSRRRIPALLLALPLAAAAFCAAQLTLERYRWQMIPAYIVVAVSLICGLLAFRLKPANVFLRATSAASLAALLLAAYWSYAYPVFQLPKPTGPYSIGTISYHLVDATRTEELSTPPGGPREVMIQVWYPASPAPGAVPQPYRASAETSFRTAYLTLVKTHAYPGALFSPAASECPVVLFTPSWHGVRNQNMAQVEDLVSHGFVVVGVDHPYGSAITVFPDGRVVRYRPQDNFDTSTDESTKEAFRVANQQVHVRAADLSFVLDSLQKFNALDPQGILTGHLDLARVGIFGYSLGGAVALQAAWQDRRFKATEDLDGMLFGESGEQGTEQPFMEVTGAPDPHHVEMPPVTDGERRWAKLTAEQDQMIAHFMTARGGYLLGIQDIGHGSFTDAAFSSPMRWISGAGGANPHVVSAVVDNYTLAFFDKFLDGKPEPLFDGSAPPFPGVSLKIFPRPAGETPGAQASPAIH